MCFILYFILMRMLPKPMQSCLAVFIKSWANIAQAANVEWNCIIIKKYSLKDKRQGFSVVQHWILQWIMQWILAVSNWWLYT